MAKHRRETTIGLRAWYQELIWLKRNWRPILLPKLKAELADALNMWRRK